MEEQQETTPTENHLCVFRIRKKNIFVLGYRMGGEIKVYGKRATKISMSHAETFQYVTDEQGTKIGIK
jgi:hypothetical protein